MGLKRKFEKPLISNLNSACYDSLSLKTITKRIGLCEPEIEVPLRDFRRRHLWSIWSRDQKSVATHNAVGPSDPEPQWRSAISQTTIFSLTDTHALQRPDVLQLDSYATNHQSIIKVKVNLIHIARQNCRICRLYGAVVTDSLTGPAYTT